MFLGSNMFSSSIPSALTGLTDLLKLNLSSNSLSGPLPFDVGKWKVLISMDLSNNQFSGDIPTGVADLKDLTHFSLSNNRIMGSIPKLQGEIPRGGLFGNYSIESFKGNEALCGAPQLHLPDCKVKPLKNSNAKAKLKIYVSLPIASTILMMALIFIILRREKNSKSWIKEAISSLQNQVVDTNLLSATRRGRSAANNCAVSILQVGLESSTEIPDEKA
ncbi:hypothetical protein V6N12_054531 [Hibiscus sabdariffa]|uniref:Uncharacterized protein n=1 Tax=Hibiscus sabdariffa TaxID=183260 RepID=A0ABR2D0R5_9ROSI